MKIVSSSRGFMLAVLAVSLAAHGLLTAAFIISAVTLIAVSFGAFASGSPGYGILQMAAFPMLLAGYFHAGNVASAEVARVMTWLFYGEWVPR